MPVACCCPRLDHGPTELQVGLDVETLTSLHSPPLYSSKRVMGLPALPFTTVEDDPYIAPVLKVPTQLLIPIQTGAGHYEDEHVSRGSEKFLAQKCSEILPPIINPNKQIVPTSAIVANCTDLFSTTPQCLIESIDGP